MIVDIFHHDEVIQLTADVWAYAHFRRLLIHHVVTKRSSRRDCPPLLPGAADFLLFHVVVRLGVGAAAVYHHCGWHKAVCCYGFVFFYYFVHDFLRAKYDYRYHLLRAPVTVLRRRLAAVD